MKIALTNSHVLQLCDKLGETLRTVGNKVYPIPRGGVPAAYALASYYPHLEILDSPKYADFFFDDVIESGETMRQWCDEYPGKPFLALIDKTSPETDDILKKWVVFPWEGDVETGVEDNIRRILQAFDPEPDREGIAETPARVAKAYKHWFGGYDKDAAAILKCFEDGAENYHDAVTVVDIPIYSHCEHHLAPIFGTVTISYIPDGKIVGLSKLSRLADMYARRLQVQERLTAEIADAIETHLKPKGVGVLVKARHMCMESRGICQQGHHTVTTALRGAMLTEPETRAEFLELAR